MIVAEAMHASADADMRELVRTVADELAAVWSIQPRSALLTSSAPRFEF